MIITTVFVVVAVSLGLCDQCCTAYQCSDYKTLEKCSVGKDYVTNRPCIWENQACRLTRCGDVTEKPLCDSYQPNCQWNEENGACVEVSSCAAWTGEAYIADCYGKSYGNDVCIASINAGFKCVKAHCENLKNSREMCEQYGLQCKFIPPSTCKPAYSCGDWDNDWFNDLLLYCPTVSINGEDCGVVGSVCKVPVCADFTSNKIDCESLGCKYSSDSGSCDEVSSCSEWSGTTQNKCRSKSYKYGDFDCVWDSNDNTCRDAVCGDYNTNQLTCEGASNVSVNYCGWKDNDCVHVQTYCEGVDGETNCNSNTECTYVSGACPSPPVDETPSGSFGTFVPSAVVVLTMTLSLLFISCI